MSQQDIIREGMEKLITQWIIKHYPIGSETFSDLVKRIQEFEDSQDVVIKVESEPESIKNSDGSNKYYGDMPSEMYDDGWRLVEPLIDTGG